MDLYIFLRNDLDMSDIRLDTSTFNIGSVATVMSGNIVATDCVYSKFEVISNYGLDFSPYQSVDNKLYFYLPENYTDSARSGYFVVRFYDTNNNTYDQTINVSQAAGTFAPIKILGGYITIGGRYLGPEQLNVTAMGKEAYHNVSWSWTNTDLCQFVSSGAGQTDYGYYDITFNLTASTGMTTISITDHDLGATDSCNIYIGSPEIAGHPRVYWQPDYSTIGQEGQTDPWAKASNNVLVVSGCTVPPRAYDVDDFGFGTVQGISGDVQDWATVSMLPYFNYDYEYSANTYAGGFGYISQTTGDTRWAKNYMTLVDTNGNSHLLNVTLEQSSAATPEKDIHVDVDEVDAGSASTIVIGNIIESGCNLSSFTYTVSGDVAVSATTGTGNTLVIDVPENDTDSARTGYLTITFYDTDGNSYEQVITVNQDAGTGGEKRIYLDPAAIIAGSGDTGACTTIVAENCTFSSMTVVNSGGTHYTSGPVVNADQMCFTFQVNPSANSRSETFSLRFYDTDGNYYSSFIVVQQLASGETQDVPEPWDKPGDTAYTWYHDDNLLRVLPEQRELAWDEVSAYWPVTAHTFPGFEVRSSGDCPFTYSVLERENKDFNSHELYAYTDNNTGETQLTSYIKLVAYSGDSAYSATTVLLKDPEADGWITAVPSPLVTDSTQKSVDVFLTITNCQRATQDEATGNTDFNSQSWVTVTLVNNTALTFNFTENNTTDVRTTHYNICGRDHRDRLIQRRLDITQEAGGKGIRIIPSKTTLSKAQGSLTARVESTEAGNFSFSASPWLSITSYVPSSEKGGILYIDYSFNEGSTDRTGNIYATQQISTAPFVLTAETAVTQIASADSGYITVDPASVGVGKQAGEVTATISYSGLATNPTLVMDSGNMNIINYSLANDTITVSYAGNSGSDSKTKTFLVTATTFDGRIVSATFTINQSGVGAPVAPIWRDYVVDLTAPGQGFINYSISHDGTVVYTGRAYAMGQNIIQIYFNHLCKSFLSNKIEFNEGEQTIRDWLGSFFMTSPELGAISTVQFFEDYSYENREMQNVMSLNNPIISEVVDGAYVPFSFFITGNSGNVEITFADSTHSGLVTGLTIDDNEQHRYFVEARPGYTYSSLGHTYKTISACDARYSLYYVNSYGGVDVLPFKGKSFKKTDNITRMNYSRSFRNNTLEFENVNYMNEIKPVWELTTSYMVDSQSKKMHELVESTCVYLYDAEEQTYTPVVMTDKKLEYKTYFNQGRKFYTYTINVEESQSKERR